MTRSAADYSPSPATAESISEHADDFDELLADDDLLDAGDPTLSDADAMVSGVPIHHAAANAGVGRTPLNRPPEALQPMRSRVPMAMAGERIDKVLARVFPEFSRARLQTWLEAGRVTIDGVIAKPRQGAPADAILIVEPEHAPETLAFQAEPVPLDIVYEDDTLVVICKPAGLVVHPGAGNWSGTLLNGLLYHYGEQAATLPRAGIVHRLDKETSGLMVVARTLTAQTDLIRQLQARTVKRRYVCAVWGNPPDSGTVDAPIGRDPRDRMKMAVVHGNAGKPARTHFRTVSKGQLGERSVAVLHCDLETGRTHQIRVHCQHIKHPLIGDPVYCAASRAQGRTAARTPAAVTPLPGDFARQALHAWGLGLRHPVTGEEMQWRADVPDDFLALAQAAGLDLGIEQEVFAHASDYLDDDDDDDLSERYIFKTGPYEYDESDEDADDDDGQHGGVDEAQPVKPSGRR